MRGGFAFAFTLAALSLCTDAHAQRGATINQIAQIDPDFVSGSRACWSDFDAIGIPEHRSEDQQVLQRYVCRARYAASINSDTRNPDWVIERLTPARLRDAGVQRSNRFIDETQAPGAGAASLNDDYVRSGYQRGHQAPAEDFRSTRQASDNSFYMSNMAPQIGPGFNGGQWRMLEDAVRNWVECGGRDNVIIITGPIYSRVRYMRRDGVRTDVRIPDEFFKIVYDVDRDVAVGFRLRNERNVPADPVEDFIVPIAEIQDDTGLEFFPHMPNRRRTQLTRHRGAPWGHIARCT